ncbi:MAG: spermidine/putrescine ABC transporter substrate-binding protein [Desulfovibrio sp.]|jgi:spermidine/putrescine transport system substrate-binding protein|nr:spermidine/putrescine ABC transporter substrate-binding protein [Desulfovibrio sp.]
MTAFRPVLFALALLLFCGSPLPVLAASPETKEVVVYNWSEYIPQDVLDDFTKETGIKVVYSTFESNEAMYAKVKLLRGRDYDVVVPSTYFVELLREEKLIQPLDLSRISNFSNLDPSLLNQDYDPGNAYSIPYMCGIMGLAYNTKYIKPGTLTSWKDLLNPELKGKIILTDDLRDAFGLALLAQGHSVNSVDPAEIRQASEFLTRLKASVRVFDVTAIKQALISEEVWTGPIWNGDYLVAREENPDLAFLFPKEGGIPWVDSFVLTSGAANVENAYAFINYMLRPEVALRCMEEFKYTSPNLAAVNLLPPDLRQNPILLPGPEERTQAEYIGSIGKALDVYEKYWEQIKTLR